MDGPEQGPRTLRFGLMCSGPELSGFERECLLRILEVPGVELALRIVNATPPQASSASRRLQKLLRIRGALWPAFQILFPWRTATAHQRRDGADVFGGVPEVHCRVTTKGKWSEYFAEADIARIREARLDFLLKFSFGIIRGEILTAARYGVWSFHHDDPDVYRGGPPAFWEIHDAAPATGAILQRLTERLDGGVLLQRCWAPTHLSSYRENYARILWASAHLPARVCRDLIHGVGQYVDAAPIKTDAPIYRSPNNRAMARFFWRCAKAWVRERYERIFAIEQWRVGIAKASVASFLSESAQPEVEWLSNPGATQYLADPFSVRATREGVNLLVERYDHKAARGVIDQCEWRAAKGAGPLSLAIDDVAHHSYPFVLEEGEQTYCIPETASERVVSLYRLNRHGEWERQTTLLDGVAAADATVFRYEDRWWMLLTDADGPKNGSLSAWYADNLTGPWTPHANNPIKSDVRSSRPAGPPFEHDGRLYRPAQDCSLTYGWRLALNRIVRLTPTEFAEELVGWRKHDPQGPCPHGFHTLVGAGPYTLVDGKKMTFSLAMAWFRVRSRLFRAG
jgi:hypothetical protein